MYIVLFSGAAIYPEIVSILSAPCLHMEEGKLKWSPKIFLILSRFIFP